MLSGVMMLLSMGIFVPIDSVGIYDLTSGNWSEGPSLPSLPNSFYRAVTYYNELYFLSNGKIWQLNTESEEWVAVATSENEAYVRYRYFESTQLIQSDSCAPGVDLILYYRVQTFL